MIDNEVFIKHVSFLETWFNTELSDLESAALYRSLSDRLDNNEFAIACRIIFEETDKGYPGRFPCAKKFIEAAQGDLQAKALKVWSNLLEAVRKGKGSDFERQTNKVVRDAIASIGGLETINETSNADLKWLKKDFTEALLRFKQAESQHQYLKSAKEQKLLGE